MAGLALLLFGTFILAVALRTLILWRRTGDTGHRPPSTRSGPAPWMAQALFGVGCLATGVAAPIAERSGLDPLAVLDRPVLRITGVVPGALGVLGTFAAQVAMGDAWRVGVDETEHTGLVTTGPFRLVRNPIFTAAVIAFTGMALTVPNPIALIGLVAFIGGVQIQVRLVEEPHLRHEHGQAYERYSAQVGRFLPALAGSAIVSPLWSDTTSDGSARPGRLSRARVGRADRSSNHRVLRGALPAWVAVPLRP